MEITIWIILPYNGCRRPGRTLRAAKAMQPLFLNGLAGLFSAVETAFTGTFRLDPTMRADLWRISGACQRLGLAGFGA